MGWTVLGAGAGPCARSRVWPSLLCPVVPRARLPLGLATGVHGPGPSRTISRQWSDIRVDAIDAVRRVGQVVARPRRGGAHLRARICGLVGGGARGRRGERLGCPRDRVAVRRAAARRSSDHDAVDGVRDDPRDPASGHRTDLVRRRRVGRPGSRPGRRDATHRSLDSCADAGPPVRSSTQSERSPAPGWRARGAGGRDCAQSAGAECDGRPTGLVGIASGTSSTRRRILARWATVACC